MKKYYAVYKLLFEEVWPHCFPDEKPIKSAYPRVGKLCKTFTEECVLKAAEKLKSAVETGVFSAPNQTATLNYLTGIATALYYKDPDLGVNSTSPIIDLINDEIGRNL